MESTRPFRSKKFEPSVCGGCTQTTDYDLAMDRGTALIVLAVYNAVRKKGKNRIHVVNEMLCDPADYASYREMVEDGRMTLRMIGNVPRARYHGLLAFSDKHSGEYLITPKGAKFLRNEKIPRVAIIDKVTHTKKAYLNEERDTITFTQAMKRETPFWNIRNFEIEADGTFRTVEDAPTTIALL